MSPVFAVIAVAALGIDVGWQPLDEGGVEYIIQIEPDQVDRMRNLDDLISDVPKDLDVRRYRITIGTEKLPRLTKKSGAPAKAAEAPAVEKVTPATKETSGPVLIDPTVEEASIAEAATRDETPAAEETTAQKPVAGTFAADPEPKDEEEGDLAVPSSRTTSRPSTDDLFESAPSRPLNSRLLEEPAEVPAPRQPVREKRFVSEQPRDDYETEKPALPDSFRTAQNTSRNSSSDFDRDGSANDGAWGSIVAIFFFLLLSMGANMWLGWIAWEARQRYQILLEKYRATGGTGSVELV